MPRTRSAPTVGESLSYAPVRSRDEESLEAVSNGRRNGFERPSSNESPPMRLGVGYLRRSTDRQEQSIGDQRAAVERFAAERGIRLLRHYVDDGISGTSTAGRRAFQQLIADAERHAKAKQARRGTGGVDDANGGFDVVVCYDVKRFGRVDNDEAGYYRHILKRCGVEVMYASEGFTGGMVDDLLRPVKQWQARQESKDLAKVVIRGLVSKATPDEARDGSLAESAEAASGGASGAGGWWMGGAPPYGYDLRYESMSGRFIFTVRYERDGTKRLLDERGELMRELAKGESVAVSKRDRCKLVLGEPERVGVVKDIFRMYTQERKGFKAVASALNRRGVSTARSKEWAAHYSGRWSITTVRAILMNPAYCGDLAWNRRTDARFYRISGGRAVERELSGAGMTANAPARRLESNDEADWIVTRDAHEPIVARRAWEEAREIIRSYDSNRPPTIRAFAPRSKSPGGAPGGWGGERTKFLLSGLVKCGRCGNAYEGRIDRPSKANAKGEKSKSYAYVCGGYLRHGKSVCSRGLIPRDELERKVIEEVIKAYRPFMGRKGRQRLERAMLEARGGELEETREARERASKRLEEIAAQARTLLDNLSEANRVFVDERLRELTREREELERRVESLDKLALSDREFQEAVREEHRHIERLEAELCDRGHDECRYALERCLTHAKILENLPRCKVDVKCRVSN